MILKKNYLKSKHFHTFATRCILFLMLFPFDTRGAAKDLAGFPHKNVESKPTIIYASETLCLVTAAGSSRSRPYNTLLLPSCEAREFVLL